MSLVEAVPAIADSDDVIDALARNRDLPRREHYAEDGGAARIKSIELKDVNFAYGKAAPVLRDINFEVRAGETIALVGPTGGGKSTLVNVICRFYEPTSGAVLTDGIDYRKRGLHWLQSNLGMVLQQAHAFSGTIRENIRYGNPDASDEEVEEAAKNANAHEFIRRLPGAYKTKLGERGSMVSGGERQRIAVARAFLRKAPILILDEPTSSIDSQTEAVILDALRRLLE
jgi:ATP-binding cassette subfamily B protein